MPPPILKKALASLIEISQDEEAREIARRREEYLRERKDEIYDGEDEAWLEAWQKAWDEDAKEGWKEGWKEGFEEGQHQARLEILSRLVEDEITKEYENSTLARLKSLSEEHVLEARRNLR